MKIRILDRILVALAGLLMLAGCAAAAAQLFFGKDVIGRVSRLLANESIRVLLIIALVLLVLLGCYCVLILFRHRSSRDKFILQKTENGELSISLKALESMVQKCLEPHKELSTQAVKLENQKGGLLIRIRGTVAGGVSIPLTVDALQQQIKQYVTACSGVEVKNIRVQIESSGPDAKDAMFAIEAPAAPALLNAADKQEKKEEPVPEIPEAAIPAENLRTDAEAPAARADEPEKDPAAATMAAAAAAAELLKNETPPEDDDRPIHQRLFSSPEEPCVMPMPPETDTEEKAEAGRPEQAEDGEKPEEMPAQESVKPEETITKEAKDAEAGLQADAAEGSIEK